MSQRTGKKGQDKPLASPKFDIDTFERLQAAYDEKLKQLEANYQEKLKQSEANFQGKVDTLHRIVEQKNDAISKLNVEIGELRASFNFMSNETTEIKKKLDVTKNVIQSKMEKTEKNVNTIREKTVDLEDRSRRNNLVFFNFKEPESGVTEDCEKKVEDFLKSLGILQGEDIWVDRAHRLGKRKPESDAKPRPIIVRFSYYKQREAIVKNGFKFKNTNINMSEDYSKETINVHNQLRKLGKDAKERLYNDNKMAIKYYKVTYRRLVVTYTSDKNNAAAPTFTRSFTLNYIQENQDWFVPPNRHQTRTQQH